MRDLSEHGFSLRAMNPLQMSEKVPFSFNLDSTARIDGEAIVIRLQDSGRVAALEFAGLSAHARDQIRRFLEKFDGAVAKESGPAPVPVQDNSTFDELRTEIRETEARPATPRLQLPIPRPELPPPAPAPAPPESLPSEPPPLLKLSSVRPETVKPVPAKWIEPEEEPEPVEVPALPIPEELATPPLQVLSAPRVQIPLAATPSEPLPELPPALEPLYSLEMESDEAAPSWMDRFTLTRAIVIMLVLTLLAGSFVYHRQLGHALVWLGQKIAGDQDSGSVRPAGIPEPKNTETVPASVDDLANSAAVTQTNSSTSPDALADNSKPAKAPDLPASTETPIAAQPKDAAAPALVPLTQVTHEPGSKAPATPGSDTGQAEYQRAHAILHETGRQADLPEAVRLLWSAVEKGNVAAEITLAELFRTGRGVARNCVQAKILLSTAARKGSADAQRRLDELQREGCPE